MQEIITSPKNPQLKFIRDLDKPRNRRKEQKFYVEGLREIQRALDNGYSMLHLLADPKRAMDSAVSLAQGQLRGGEKEVKWVEGKLLNTLLVRQDQDGLLAVFAYKNYSFQDFRVQNDSVFIICQNLEKPGNLGAILRTSEALGVQGIFLCDETVEVYNPYVIRSSLGTVFSIPVLETNTQDMMNWLRQHKIYTYCTNPDAKQLLWDTKIEFPAALVFGSEGFGLDKSWLNAYLNIKIPMFGKIDSLNIANSAAICMYECVKQKIAVIPAS